VPFWGDIPYRTRVVILGVALTVAVLLMEATGALAPFEGWLYDTRALRCRAFTPPPTTQIVHMDIDDAAIETVGKWPWPRRLVAAVVDELREAGARALALDIIFSDEDAPGAVVLATTLPTTLPATGRGVVTPPAPVADADDELLAAAIERFG
jgi:adenylate cyclase